MIQQNFLLEKRIPTNVSEALEEFERRLFITAQSNMGVGQVNLRPLLKELLEDFVQGLEAKSKGIIITTSSLK